MGIKKGKYKLEAITAIIYLLNPLNPLTVCALLITGFGARHRGCSAIGHMSLWWLLIIFF